MFAFEYGWPLPVIRIHQRHLVWESAVQQHLDRPVDNAARSGLETLCYGAEDEGCAAVLQFVYRAVDV